MPCAGIVHHLSGPNRYAHTQTSLNRSVGCWCKDPSSRFHCAHRFNHPRTRTYVRLLGPCFKTGRKKPFSHHLLHKRIQPSTFNRPGTHYHVLRVLSTRATQMAHQARTITRSLLKPTYSACAEIEWRRISERQSHPDALVPFASLSAISGTFNSLFKVLFIFPSWYLFSIGLELIFSFR